MNCIKLIPILLIASFGLSTSAEINGLNEHEFDTYLFYKKIHLKSIAIQESNDNRNVIHKSTAKDHPVHFGASAYGKYGLMPATVKLTIKKHKDLYYKYKHLLSYDDNKIHSALNKNPHLEHLIASKLYDEYAREFGQDISFIYYSWLYGPGKTRRDRSNPSLILNNRIIKNIVNITEKLQQNQ